MKKLMFAFVGMVFVSARTLAAADQPRGNLVELHSCELYAGGCVVSSEATRSEEHTSELQSRFGISYALFCLKKQQTLISSYRTGKRRPWTSESFDRARF